MLMLSLSALGKQEIQCSDIELVTIQPPSGQTCSQYMDPYISAAGGYLSNANATSDCGYCSFATTDAFLGQSFNIFYSNHWRDLGIFVAFIFFNVSPSPSFIAGRAEQGADGGSRTQIACIYSFTYLFRVRTGSLFGSLKSRLAARRAKSA